MKNLRITDNFAHKLTHNLPVRMGKFKFKGPIKVESFITYIAISVYCISPQDICSLRVTSTDRIY